MQSITTEVRRGVDLLMSSRAKRTAAIMAAAIISVEAKRSRIFGFSLLVRDRSFSSHPLAEYRRIKGENQSQDIVACASLCTRC